MLQKKSATHPKRCPREAGASSYYLDLHILPSNTKVMSRNNDKGLEL
jgi:hypothetical protein